MSLTQTCVAKLYGGVIEEVIGGVREFFMDEGVDEQVLMELKHTWESRLQATKAVEVKQDPEPQPPALKNIQKTRNQIHAVLPGPVLAASMALSQDIATALLQQHITHALQGQAAGVIQIQTANNGIQNSSNSTSNKQTFPQQAASGVSQLDGQHDSSDDDDEDDEDEEEQEDDDDDDADDREDDENEDNDAGAEEEPLNSGDDVSEEDPSDLFETDNVVVCQYDKITRSRNKWKFYLKDGIMNLAGKDYVFQKSNGDAEW